MFKVLFLKMIPLAILMGRKAVISSALPPKLPLPTTRRMIRDTNPAVFTALLGKWKDSCSYWFTPTTSSLPKNAES